jgi:hypothetical protein
VHIVGFSEAIEEISDVIMERSIKRTLKTWP